MNKDSSTYQELYRDFKWEIPTHYNIGYDASEKWAIKTPHNPAIIEVFPDGNLKETSYFEFDCLANRGANYLSKMGAKKGDRIGILLPQSLECAISHIVAFKLGAISVPLFLLFGPDALSYRILNAGIQILITDNAGASKLRKMTDSAQRNLQIYTVDGADPKLRTNDLCFFDLKEPIYFKCVNTRADDPATITYTSGTTGSPKGALHAHRVLLGHLPGFEMFLNLFSKYKKQKDNLLWTPADWAWMGGLYNILFPGLHHGIPVLAHRFEKFSGEKTFELMSDHKITGSFLPPTALKLLRACAPESSPTDLYLKSVGSGGEPLGTELVEWGQKVLGVTINEFYGQTECNLVLSSCKAIMEPRPGIAGPSVPGHFVRVINAEGRECPLGKEGLIAIKVGPPQMFLRYWENAEATQEKFVGDWMLTGDRGVMERDLWIRFIARDDDVITSSGYRIGPVPIEDCLMGHPSVSMAAVVGKPDKVRTEIVKAFIVLKPGWSPSAELKVELQVHVKKRLSAHEYPREIEILENLPVTNTGKILRRKLRDMN